MAFFAEYLKNAGVFDDWVGDCPLSYSSPNASTNRDILGTWMLSVMAGHKRYEHVVAGRRRQPAGSRVRRIVSEDALRLIKTLNKERISQLFL